MSGNEGAWAVVLEGAVLSGDNEAEALGILSVPPEGLDPPDLRTEDVTYPQRDGVQHFSDWYGPRFITLADVSVCNDGCPGCPSARAKVRDLTAAWSRKCDDVELVIFTDCHDPDASDEDRALTGPFGVIGRPRVANYTWLTSNLGCAIMLFRFDAVDHRLYVLDGDGTPGSGGRCVTLNASTITFCRSYPRCYDMCYSNDISTPGSGPVDANVTGMLCAHPTIELIGTLTNPVIENLSTGEFIGYNAPIGATAPPVIIDTYTGTATQGGASRTHLLTGNPRMSLAVGGNTLRLNSAGIGDDGSAEVCWRPAVISG